MIIVMPLLLLALVIVGAYYIWKSPKISGYIKTGLTFLLLTLPFGFFGGTGLFGLLGVIFLLLGGLQSQDIPEPIRVFMKVLLVLLLIALVLIGAVIIYGLITHRELIGGIFRMLPSLRQGLIID